MAAVQVGQDESELREVEHEDGEKEGQGFDRMLKPAPYMGQAVSARQMYLCY